MKKGKRTKSGNVRLPAQTLQIAPRPGYLLDYQNCSDNELRGFLTARGGDLEAEQPNPKIRLTQQAARKQVRIQLIRKLAQMDEEATFPFLDLLPELRNMIYVELLSRDKKVGRRAHVEILRTSKQVHEEGTGILLAESIASVNAILSGADVSPTMPEKGLISLVELDGDVKVSTFDGQSTEYDDNLPLDRLSKIQNLHIDLEIFYSGSVVYDWPDFSATIGRMVQSFSKLVKVTIQVNKFMEPSPLEPKAKCDQLARILGSLSQFSNKVTVDIRGLDEAAYDAVWKRINSS